MAERGTAIIETRDNVYSIPSIDRISHDQHTGTVTLYRGDVSMWTVCGVVTRAIAAWIELPEDEGYVFDPTEAFSMGDFVDCSGTYNPNGCADESEDTCATGQDGPEVADEPKSLLDRLLEIICPNEALCNSVRFVWA